MARAARDSAERVEIQITLTLEHEYARRGVFPELRHANATSVNCQGAATHTVTLARARELVTDAEAQRLDRSVPGRLKTAYAGIRKRTREAIAREEDHPFAAPEAEADDEAPPQVAGAAASRAVAIEDEDEDEDEDDDDDDEWPPAVRHNPAIEVGDGSRWHYLAAPDVLLLEGVLDAGDIPGNAACAQRWRKLGRYGDKWFQAVRLGHRVAVTLLDGSESSIARCVPLKFKP